ncbi:hypothetical protein GQ53DRAFT_842432 [Thozetella sp. PMI_491]|nr:hypothetical protein GQ53DRAFT_842432 [Thozetella sp. PMI_491]
MAQGPIRGLDLPQAHEGCESSSSWTTSQHSVSASSFLPPQAPCPRPWHRVRVRVRAASRTRQPLIWKRVGGLALGVESAGYIAAIAELDSHGQTTRKRARSAAYVPLVVEARWDTRARDLVDGKEDVQRGKASVMAAQEVAGTEPASASLPRKRSVFPDIHWVPRKRDNARWPIEPRMSDATKAAALCPPIELRGTTAEAVELEQQTGSSSQANEASPRPSSRASGEGTKSTGEICETPRARKAPFQAVTPYLSPLKRLLATPATRRAGVSPVKRLVSAVAPVAITIEEPSESASPSVADEKSKGVLAPVGKDSPVAEATRASPVGSAWPSPHVFDQPLPESPRLPAHEAKRRVSLHTAMRIDRTVLPARASAEARSDSSNRRRSWGFGENDSKKSTKRRHTLNPVSREVEGWRPMSAIVEGEVGETSEYTMSSLGGDDTTVPLESTLVVDVGTNLDIFGQASQTTRKRSKETTPSQKPGAAPTTPTKALGGTEAASAPVEMGNSCTKEQLVSPEQPAASSGPSLTPSEVLSRARASETSRGIEEVSSTLSPGQCASAIVSSPCQSLLVVHESGKAVVEQGVNAGLYASPEVDVSPTPSPDHSVDVDQDGLLQPAPSAANPSSPAIARESPRHFSASPIDLKDHRPDSTQEAISKIDAAEMAPLKEGQDNDYPSPDGSAFIEPTEARSAPSGPAPGLSPNPVFTLDQLPPSVLPSTPPYAETGAEPTTGVDNEHDVILETPPGSMTGFTPINSGSLKKRSRWQPVDADVDDEAEIDDAIQNENQEDEVTVEEDTAELDAEMEAMDGSEEVAEDDPLSVEDIAMGEDEPLNNHDDSETEILRQFVTRVTADKSAKAAAATTSLGLPRRKLRLQRRSGSMGSTSSTGSPISKSDSPLKRRPLGERDRNSPSPRKKRKPDEGDHIFKGKPIFASEEPSPQPKQKRRRKRLDLELETTLDASMSQIDDAEVEPSVPGPRRSTRARAARVALKPASPSANSIALSMIPIRLPGQAGMLGDTALDSNLAAARNRSEEKDLAAITRVNTRKNKGNSVPARMVLARQVEDPAWRMKELKGVFDAKESREAEAADADADASNDGRKSRKENRVRWAEILACFQTEEEAARTRAKPSIDDDAKTVDIADAPSPQPKIAEATADKAEKATGKAPRRTRASKLQAPTPIKKVAVAVPVDDEPEPAPRLSSAHSAKKGMPSSRGMGTRRTKIASLGMSVNGTPAPKRRARTMH